MRKDVNSNMRQRPRTKEYTREKRLLPPFTRYIAHDKSTDSASKESSSLIISSRMKSHLLPKICLLIKQTCEALKVNDGNAHLLVHFDPKMAKSKPPNPVPMPLPLHYSHNGIQFVESMN